MPTGKPDYARCRQRLLELKQQVLGVADLVASSSRPVTLDQNSVGRLSRMDAMQGQAMAEAGVQRQHLALKAIESSLAKLQTNEYGHCECCDEWIAQARLNVDPIATYCIECATQMESGG